jgi:hypothetical protein
MVEIFVGLALSNVLYRASAVVVGEFCARITNQITVVRVKGSRSRTFKIRYGANSPSPFNAF